MEKQKMSDRAKAAAKAGMQVPPQDHGKTSDVTRREDVRHVERGHRVPPRSEPNR
jgi:hypothetical protein